MWDLQGSLRGNAATQVKSLNASQSFNHVIRYAEKDHQQMVELSRQRAELRQKLAKRSHSEVDV